MSLYIARLTPAIHQALVTRARHLQRDLAQRSHDEDSPIR